jgi:hypothetical protein
MGQIHSKFSAAREKYSKQLFEKKAEIKALEDKLRLLAEIEGDIEKDTTNQINTPSSHSRYSSLGLTDAAIDAVMQMCLRLGVSQRVTKMQVVDYMIKQGFKSSGKNFPVSVDTALRRYVDRGVLITVKENGSRYYAPKEVSIPKQATS